MLDAEGDDEGCGRLGAPPQPAVASGGLPSPPTGGWCFPSTDRRPRPQPHQNDMEFANVHGTRRARGAIAAFRIATCPPPPGVPRDDEPSRVCPTMRIAVASRHAAVRAASIACSNQPVAMLLTPKDPSHVVSARSVISRTNSAVISPAERPASSPPAWEHAGLHSPTICKCRPILCRPAQASPRPPRPRFRRQQRLRTPLHVGSRRMQCHRDQVALGTGD